MLREWLRAFHYRTRVCVRCDGMKRFAPVAKPRGVPSEKKYELFFECLHERFRASSHPHESFSRSGICTILGPYKAVLYLHVTWRNLEHNPYVKARFYTLVKCCGRSQQETAVCTLLTI